MAPSDISDVCANLDQLALSVATALSKGNIKKSNLTYKGQPLAIRLRGEELESMMTVAFEPSVYQGTGAEARKGIVFRLSNEDFETFQKLEEWCKQSLATQVPNADAIWSDSAKLTDKWGAQLRAKINVSGPYVANFYDESKRPCQPPQAWKGLQASALLQVRGCYVQRNSVGLLLDVTHLRYAEPQATDVECPI